MHHKHMSLTKVEVGIHELWRENKEHPVIAGRRYKTKEEDHVKFCECTSAGGTSSIPLAQIVFIGDKCQR